VKTSAGMDFDIFGILVVPGAKKGSDIFTYSNLEDILALLHQR